MTPESFPVALVLQGLSVLVVGNDVEAARRARALRAAGAVVVLLSERPSAELLQLSTEPDFTLHERAFEPGDLDGAWLAVATDTEPAVAERIADAAEARRVFFCAVDGTRRSTFAHVAVARSGGLTLTVSTSGRVPALARRLREELERLLAESPIDLFVARLAALRERTPSSDRRTVLTDALRGLRLSGRLEIPDVEAPPPARGEPGDGPDST